ncbi:MAG: LacI family DNA-binding transcriptional regulator [Chloroflexota bacterium]|jgi:LacI family transcriptional regulator|nr:LacI family transcriptional regulator [Anaerolineae bacterium]HMM27203.1 LacI family DNA-binding transcriptional regulator [Aggregatilineaceae bacterium]
MSAPKNAPPTIYDVASLSGLSIATVSRVLNTPDRVSEASRQRVMQAVDQLGYVPQAEMRARALRHTRRIGVLTPFFTSPSFVDRLRGVASALSSVRSELVVYSVSSIDSLQAYLASLPITGDLDGLIIMSLPLDGNAAQRLRANRLETVLIEHPHPEFSAVLVDDRTGGQLAARHLLEKGHRRCAYVYFGSHPDYAIHPETERLAGFRETLAAHGVTLDDEHIRYVPVSRQGIEEQLRALFELPEPPTGLFVPSDDLAIRVIHRARELGVHTPRDISVIGFDGIDIAEHVDLTTISQSLIESGKTAVDLLMARLADSTLPIQHIRTGVYLIERGTTRALE